MDSSRAGAGRTFDTVRAVVGYDIDEVDRFLAEVETALRHDPPLITAEQVQRIRFSPVRLRTGYAMGQVDAYLDRLEASLRHRHAGETTTDPAPTYDGIPGVEERRTSQPPWVRMVALLALLAMLVLVVAQIF